MVRQAFSGWSLALVLAASTAGAQTVVTWGGGFPNDRFSVGSNWAGGLPPLNDGTETLQFTDNSDTYLYLNRPGDFNAISLLDTGTTTASRPSSRAPYAHARRRRDHDKRTGRLVLLHHL